MANETSIKEVSKVPTITISLPKDIHDGLEELAAADDRKVAQYVTRNVKRLYECGFFDGQTLVKGE